MQGYIAIKGTRNGLLLTLEPGTPFSDLLTALSERLSEAPSFFKGASLSLDTTRRTLEADERTQLESLLANYQMSVSAAAAETLNAMPAMQAEAAPVETPESAEPAETAEPAEVQPVIKQDEEISGAASSAGTTNTASAASVAGAVDMANAANSIDSTNSIHSINAADAADMAEAVGIAADPRESSNTLFLRRTIRSGQAINHPSNVVVLGDVNHGAEIVAGGDIIVWGALRGMVHAGYPDNEQALVCSLALAPVQLRIAHLLSRPPEGFEVQPRPEVAAIRNNQIVVEAWINGRPPRK